WFVPALLGMGTPAWDFGARGTLLGLTRGTGRPELVRAVLEGIAHRGADLVEAAEADAGTGIGSLRIDGGRSADTTCAQAHAVAAAAGCRAARRRRVPDGRGPRRPGPLPALRRGRAARGGGGPAAPGGEARTAIRSPRLAGGMTANPSVVQARADATQRPVEV